MKKNNSAVALGRRRWADISPEERSRLAAETARKRWRKASLRDRKRQAAVLTAGRRRAATARKRRAKREKNDNTDDSARKSAAQKISSQSVVA